MWSCQHNIYITYVGHTGENNHGAAHLDEWKTKFTKKWSDKECKRWNPKNNKHDVTNLKDENTDTERFHKPRLEDLNKEQRMIVDDAVQTINKGRQLLMMIHGPPGVGKTKYVVKAIMNECRRRSIFSKFVGPSGVAAKQCNGSTIHSNVHYSYSSWFFFHWIL